MNPPPDFLTKQNTGGDYQSPMRNDEEHSAGHHLGGVGNLYNTEGAWGRDGLEALEQDHLDPRGPLHRGTTAGP